MCKNMETTTSLKKIIQIDIKENKTKLHHLKEIGSLKSIRTIYRKKQQQKCLYTKQQCYYFKKS